MKITAIIPAAGDGQRWGNYLGTVKQLAPVGVEERGPLLLRTIRILKDLDVNDIYVLTHVPQIISRVQSIVRVIRPSRYQYLSDTILSSVNVWSEKTMVLLGDVYFSRECMEAMVCCEKNVCFWGVEPGSLIRRQNLKRAEIYGFTFNSLMHPMVKESLDLNSTLSSTRDRGFLLIRALLLGRSLFCKVFRQNYPPKPPSLLRSTAVGGNRCWSVYRALKGKKPRNAWRYGKLWGLYLTMSDIDPFGGQDYRWPENRREDFCQIEDYTQDIDSAEDYQNLIAFLSGNTERPKISKSEAEDTISISCRL
jgi:hypothetical protein